MPRSVDGLPRCRGCGGCLPSDNRLGARPAPTVSFAGSMRSSIRSRRERPQPQLVRRPSARPPAARVRARWIDDVPDLTLLLRLESRWTNPAKPIAAPVVLSRIAGGVGAGIPALFVAAEPVVRKRGRVRRNAREARGVSSSRGPIRARARRLGEWLGADRVVGEGGFGPRRAVALLELLAGAARARDRSGPRSRTRCSPLGAERRASQRRPRSERRRLRLGCRRRQDRRRIRRRLVLRS